MGYCPLGIVAAPGVVKPGPQSRATGPRSSAYRRRDVDEAHLHPLLAVPAIDRERAGRMHRTAAIAQEGRAELLAGGPECDDVDGRAVAAAQARGERLDLVITDLGMPHVDGRKVAASIKALSSVTPVILLTGWGQRLLAAHDIPPHVDRLLSKPPRLQELRSALEELVA